MLRPRRSARLARTNVVSEPSPAEATGVKLESNGDHASGTAPVKVESRVRRRNESNDVDPVQGFGEDSPSCPVWPGSPFPGWCHPQADECTRVYTDLMELYRDDMARDPVVRATGVETSSPSPHTPVLNSLVHTILSQSTTDVQSSRVMGQLMQRYPAWDDVASADPTELHEVIKPAGLASTKGPRIQAILRALQDEHEGKATLEHLRGMSNEEVRAELSRFKGVGPKTVACVLLFGLRRPVFAVDTHVFRLTSQRLGWLPTAGARKRHNDAVRKRQRLGTTTSNDGLQEWPSVTRETTYQHLDSCIPDELKYGLHVLMIRHGKAMCRARGCSDPRACPVCKNGTRFKKKLRQKRVKRPS